MTRLFDAWDDWAGALQSRSRGTATITLRAPIQRAQSSGAGAFLGVADDGNQYWFKVPGNHQGNFVLANEVIVERVGSLIGAPVCARKLAWVMPSAMAWESYPVRPSGGEAVIAHASSHVKGAIDDDAFSYTRRDDNSRRQASLLALWDWCLGDDEQWLYEAARSSSIWSYDHGLWFTTGEGDWNSQILRGLETVDGSFSDPPSGLNAQTLLDVADRIDAVSQDELLEAVSEVPVEWGIPSSDLEAMGWLLYRRAPNVAHRTRTLSSSIRPSRTGSP